MTTSRRSAVTDRRHGGWAAAGVIAALMVLLAPGALLACPVCYGDPSSEMTTGLNNGILVLLGVVGGVQAGFVALFWNLRKRAKEIEARRGHLHLVDQEPRESGPDRRFDPILGKPGGVARVPLEAE